MSKDTISFDDFLKLDLRIGTVTKAEAVPKSKKLLKLEVSFGTESRVIMAGIAGSFNPETIPGTQVVAVLNLAPREMMGVTSHGMLLAAHAADGVIVLASCPGAPDGADLG